MKWFGFRKSVPEIKDHWYWVNIEHLTIYGGHFYFEFLRPINTIKFWLRYCIKYNWKRFKRLGFRKFHLTQKD